MERTVSLVKLAQTDMQLLMPTQMQTLRPALIILSKIREVRTRDLTFQLHLLLNPEPNLSNSNKVIIIWASMLSNSSPQVINLLINNLKEILEIWEMQNLYLLFQLKTDLLNQDHLQDRKEDQVSTFITMQPSL
jgi:hypothetical protein